MRPKHRPRLPSVRRERADNAMVVAETGAWIDYFDAFEELRSLRAWHH